MKMYIRLENRNDFYQMVLRLMTRPFKGDDFDDYASPIIKNQSDFNEIFGFHGIDKNIGEDSFCQILQSDIDNESIDGISSLDLDGPRSYPCLMYINSYETYDRYGSMLNTSILYIPLSGTHTISELDTLNKLYNDVHYIELCDKINSRKYNSLEYSLFKEYEDKINKLKEGTWL